MSIKDEKVMNPETKGFSGKRTQFDYRDVRNF